MLDTAWIAFDTDRVKARTLLGQALNVAQGAGDPELVCTIYFRLGDIAGSIAEAESYYRAALAEAERSGDPYLLAWAWLDLGFNRARSAKFGEAVPILERAQQAAQQADALALVSKIAGNLGWCYLSLGDLDRALEAHKRAESLAAKVGLRDQQHRWLTSIGNIYLDRGDVDAAERYQQRALALARAVGNRQWTAIVLNNLAVIALRRKDLDAAQSYNDQALAIKRGLDDKWSLVYSELNAAVIEARRQEYGPAERDFRALIAEAPQAFAPDVLWTAHGMFAEMYRHSQRPALAEAEYRRAIDTLDRQWAKLTSDDFKRTFLSPGYLIGVFQDYVSFLLERGQTVRALEMAESSRARVLSEKLERAEALPQDLQLNKLISAARASHTVILSYWLMPDRSAVWVLGSSGLSYKALPPAPQIAELVRQHTDAIANGQDPLAAGASATALYKAILEPVEKLIPSGSNVILVPDGALHQLNFETLVAPSPQPHYWIEDVALAVAPSLRVLETAPRKPRTPRLLLLGDPVLTGQDFAPLINVSREIAAVEEHFPAPHRLTFEGAAAVPSAYAKASPAGFTHIHFATHATANNERPLYSAIVLSHQGDTFELLARDVAPVPLTADLVTISACRTAGPKAYSGEGLMGFAWAFLYAGAENVIATLWDEDDAMSVGLMQRLYDGLAAGQTPARALRSAKLALLAGGGRGRLPYYWGPLMVFTRQIAK